MVREAHATGLVVVGPQRWETPPTLTLSDEALLTPWLRGEKLVLFCHSNNLDTAADVAVAAAARRALDHRTATSNATMQILSEVSLPSALPRPCSVAVFLNVGILPSTDDLLRSYIHIIGQALDDRKPLVIATCLAQSTDAMVRRFGSPLFNRMSNSITWTEGN